jgi:hypothetical protein
MQNTYGAHRAQPTAMSVPSGFRAIAGHLITVVRAAFGAAAASLWQALAGALVLLLAGTAGGMLLYGDRVYVGPTYYFIKLAPGGMHTYGVALAVLLVMLIYGYGQHHAGNGAVLRLALALTAAWYVGWIIAIVSTYAIQGALYSWSAITANVFIAAVANLVARNVPPDRG